MAEKAVEITKIKLNLGGKEIELTIEQARKLKESLDNLFGREVVKEIHVHDRYTWWWTSPPITIPTYIPTYYPVPTWPVLPTVTWEVTSGSGGMSGYAGTLCLSA